MGNSFLDENPNIHANPCDEYWVEAIWTEGISEPSNIVTICIPGTGIAEGSLTDIETGEPIGEAILTFTRQTNGNSYMIVSDDEGSYIINYIAPDLYTIDVSHPYYISETMNSVEAEYNQTIVQDFQLIPFPFEVDTVIVEIINDTTAHIEWIPDSTFIERILSYEVYRKACDEISDWELIETTNDLSYNDEDWNTLELEEYQYAIKTVYALNSSQYKSSNCFYTNPDATVYIELTTNTGDSPEGCSINFTNISDTSIHYNTILNATGMDSIEVFRKGVYDYTVFLEGYAQINRQEVLVDSDTTFILDIEELLLPVKDLYVTPTGVATWNTINTELVNDLVENFNDGIPDDWTIINGGNSEDTWVITDTPNLNNSNFMHCSSQQVGESSEMDEYLVSPVFNAYTGLEIILEWDQNYQNFSPEDYFEVEIFNGYEWIQVYFQNTDDNAWPEINHQSLDISEYANYYLQVRFHYVANSQAWYVGVDNIMIYLNAGKSNKEFQFFKIWHNEIFTCDWDTNYYLFGTNPEVEILVPGETYLAEVAALYATGLSAKSEYEWTYMPSGSFQGPSSMDVYNMEGTNDMSIQWQNLDQLELLELNQNYGDAEVAYYQNFDYGYGVVYDFSMYPDAMINAVDFRHSSWGIEGEWDYNIHIIDWDSKTTLATLGPFQSTVNNNWEELVDVGEVLSGGASEIAILLEPLSNLPNNAYPRLDCDNSENANGSIMGNLSDLEGMTPSDKGNFLMDVWIQTSNGGKKKIANKQIPNYYAIGTNVYRNEELLAFIPDPDTSYIDQNVEPGYYDYCVATVYTADSALHTWTSSISEICVVDVICPPQCNEPQNLVAEYDTDLGNDLYWNPPTSKNNLLGYNVYCYDEQVNEELVTETYYYHSCNNSMEMCYEVTAVYDDCESEPSNEACSYPWGIGEFEDFAEIFPNPANNQIKIQSEINISGIKIYQQTGQLSFESEKINNTEYTIDLENMNSGVYLIEIELENNIQKSKFIIN